MPLNNLAQIIIIILPATCQKREKQSRVQRVIGFAFACHCMVEKLARDF